MATLWGCQGAGALASSSDEETKIVINIPSRTLWLYSGDRIVAYYPVGLGRQGFQTPTGRYKVIRKVTHPVWENPYKPSGRSRIGAGPGNPLGTRWIGFKINNIGEYGIHGTNRPDSVGKFVSHGCVRMKTKDAEALFDWIEVGTPVEVIYETVLIRLKEEQVLLIVFKDRFKKGMPSVQEVHQRILTQYPNAVVDNAKIQSALQLANERPIVVGHLE